MKNLDLTHAIDWISVKLTGLTVGICAIVGNDWLTAAGLVATISTIAYNAIRIFKELRKTKTK